MLLSYMPVSTHCTRRPGYREALHRPAVLNEDADVVGDIGRLYDRIVENLDRRRLIVGVALLQVSVARVLALAPGTQSFSMPTLMLWDPVT